MDFVKMHACGNDYIYLDLIAHRLTATQYQHILSHIPAMCHRHYGIGADGVVFVSKRDTYRMDMYNADGTMGAICGNALRCVAHLLHSRYNVSFPLSITTPSGMVQVYYVDGLYRIAMVRALSLGDKTLVIDGRSYTYKLVDIGNRHAVVRRCALPIEQVHAAICREQEDINVELYHLSGDVLHMQVYERGSGVTLACGSGACATAYAAKLWGDVCLDHISVVMPGGRVQVSFSRDNIYLTGDAVFVYTGQYPLEENV